MTFSIYPKNLSKKNNVYIIPNTEIAETEKKSYTHQVIDSHTLEKYLPILSSHQKYTYIFEKNFYTGSYLGENSFLQTLMSLTTASYCTIINFIASILATIFIIVTVITGSLELHSIMMVVLFIFIIITLSISILSILIIHSQNDQKNKMIREHNIREALNNINDLPSDVVKEYFFIENKDPKTVTTLNIKGIIFKPYSEENTQNSSYIEVTSVKKINYPNINLKNIFDYSLKNISLERKTENYASCINIEDDIFSLSLTSIDKTSYARNRYGKKRPHQTAFIEETYNPNIIEVIKKELKIIQSQKIYRHIISHLKDFQTIEKTDDFSKKCFPTNLGKNEENILNYCMYAYEIIKEAKEDEAKETNEKLIKYIKDADNYLSITSNLHHITSCYIVSILKTIKYSTEYDPSFISEKNNIIKNTQKRCQLIQYMHELFTSYYKEYNKEKSLKKNMKKLNDFKKCLDDIDTNTDSIKNALIKTQDIVIVHTKKQ